MSSFQIESYEGGGKVLPSIVVEGASPDRNRIVIPGQDELHSSDAES